MFIGPYRKQQGSICETRKGPNRPPIRMGIDYLIYALVLEIQSYGQFWPTSVGRNCQKAHLYAKTFHMSLFPGLYDHPLQRYSLEKPMFKKKAVLGILAKFGHFSVAESGQNCQKAHLQAKTFHMSLFPGLYYHPFKR